ESGTLDAGGSASFQFAGPAGRYVYFDGRNPSATVSYNLADPNGSTMLLGNNLSDNALVLPQSGTYTLTLHNTGGTSQAYGFSFIDTQGSAVTPLTLGEDVTGAPEPYAADVYSFQGTTGQQLYLNLFYNNPGSSV